jgi:hypothetical protein
MDKKKYEKRIAIVLMNATACRNPDPSGAGQGKLFIKRKAAVSHFVSLSGRRISFIYEGVLQTL